MPSLFVQLSRAALRLQGYINERITRILVEDEMPPENHDPDSDSDNESDEETIVGDDEIYYITPEEYFDPPPAAIVEPVDPPGGVHVDVVEYDFAHHEDIFADDLVAGGAEEIVPVNEIVNQEVIPVIDENVQPETQPGEALPTDEVIIDGTQVEKELVIVPVRPRKRRRDDEDERDAKRLCLPFTPACKKFFPELHEQLTHRICNVLGEDDMERLTKVNGPSEVRMDWINEDGLDYVYTPLSSPMRRVEVEFDFASASQSS